MTLRSPRFFSAPGMVVDLLLVVLRLTKTRFLLLSECNVVCRTNFGTLLFTHSYHV